MSCVCPPANAAGLFFSQSLLISSLIGWHLCCGSGLAAMLITRKSAAPTAE